MIQVLTVGLSGNVLSHDSLFFLLLSHIGLVDYGAHRDRHSPAAEQQGRASGGRTGFNEDQAGPGSSTETHPWANHGRM